MLKKIWTFIRRRCLPYLMAHAAKTGVRLLLYTCRVQMQGLDRFTEVAKSSPCILMLWHNRLIIVSEILNSCAPQFIYTAFISKSRDGEPLAILAQSYKSGRVLRVPHNARHTALGQMISHLKEHREIILITPDGPRGPRYVVKSGIALAAREASAKVIPFSWQASRAWTLNTWDKMMIPKPFSRISVSFGEPVVLQKDKKDNLEKETTLLQESLLALESIL